MHEANADVVVVGGGLGGCAATIALARMGRRVILTEETDWLGGQLTSQAVPPDEHPWIEQFGATFRYRELRERIREYYRRNYPLSEPAAAVWNLNPGNGIVSPLCHLPSIAVAALEAMLAPFVHSGRAVTLLRHRPVSADVDGDRIRGVTVRDLETGVERVLTGEFFLDATELGELLPITGTEYRTGSEAQAVTGELHAHDGESRPLNMQAVSVCFAVDDLPGQDHSIDRPPNYGAWRDFVPDLSPPWPGKLFSWTDAHPHSHQPRFQSLFGEERESYGSRWTFRRIVDRRNFRAGLFDSDVTLVNWPQIDYFVGPICEVSESESAAHLASAREQSLSFLYWMQTEAPRADGGVGYPGLRIRPDVTGTSDGLAKYPYVRESRRIEARYTVVEQDVGAEARGVETAEFFEDSVGLGWYRIDLHPSTGGDNYIDVPCLPFQIPLRSLLPVRMRNLLPACKNIGTTHITNGCYRLHPVEWNIGEAAGYLAAYCLEQELVPSGVLSESHLADFQHLLANEGVELAWPAMGSEHVVAWRMLHSRWDYDSQRRDVSGGHLLSPAVARRMLYGHE